MRYVDLQKLVLPAGWLARAQVAAEDIANGVAPDDRKAVWGVLKDGLASLLHDKCWYCETHVDRSDNAVDHFRPKVGSRTLSIRTLDTTGLPSIKATFATPARSATADGRAWKTRRPGARLIAFHY